MVSTAEIGKMIKARRRQRKLSQLDVAREIPTSRPNYTNWENGKVEISIGDLKKIAKILDVPLSYFFPEDEWAPEGTPAAFFNGLSADVQPVVLEMMKAAKAQIERQRTTHGRKAE